MADVDADLGITFTGNIAPESIDVSHLISILRSQQQLIKRSSDFIYGPRTIRKIGIKNVSAGSIDIGSVFQFVGSMQPAFALLPSASLGITTIAEMVKAWLSLLKHLGQKPPVAINQYGDGQNVIIENATGDTQIVNGNIYNTFIMGNIGYYASAFQAPMNFGATGMKLKSRGKVIAEYSRNDVEQFVKIQPESDIVTSKIEAILSVVSPVLEGEGIWKFKYGGATIPAKISDDSFLSGVFDGSESFKRGDAFKVLLATNQKQIGRNIVTTHLVERVLTRI